MGMQRIVAAECRNQHAASDRSPEFTLARAEALASINVIIPSRNVVTFLTNYLLFQAVHDTRD
jgi:hypothetical protein